EEQNVEDEQRGKVKVSSAPFCNGKSLCDFPEFCIQEYVAISEHPRSNHGCQRPMLHHHIAGGQEPELSSLGFVQLREENLIVQQHSCFTKFVYEDIEATFIKWRAANEERTEILDWVGNPVWRDHCPLHVESEMLAEGRLQVVSRDVLEENGVDIRDDNTKIEILRPTISQVFNMDTILKNKDKIMEHVKSAVPMMSTIILKKRGKVMEEMEKLLSVVHDFHGFEDVDEESKEIFISDPQQEVLMEPKDPKIY
ncbi:hypothetical protein EI555_008341, partial [Monodon monoceros]